jgi:hypothetical protein
MNPHSFELKVKLVDEELILELFELPPEGERRNGVKPTMMSKLDAEQMALVQVLLSKALRNGGYSISDVKRTRKAPFKLKEEDGIRLDLAFRGSKGISKRSRIEDIVTGISSMGREEAYYWHAKVTRGNDRENWNGIKAMRILLAGE